MYVDAATRPLWRTRPYSLGRGQRERALLEAIDARLDVPRHFMYEKLRRRRTTTKKRDEASTDLGSKTSSLLAAEAAASASGTWPVHQGLTDLSARPP